MSKTFLKVTEDNTEALKKMLESFKKDAVLVGIPASDSPRENQDNEPINNATILAINEFGSPANNIPARPVMAIGIRNAQDQIVEEFKKAMERAGTPSQWEMYMNRVGLIASNSIKKAINAQEGIDAPADSTLAARRARGFKGTKALIVTGQLRNSITYVISYSGDVIVTKRMLKAAGF